MRPPLIVIVILIIFIMMMTMMKMTLATQQSLSPSSSSSSSSSIPSSSSSSMTMMIQVSKGSRDDNNNGSTPYDGDGSDTGGRDNQSWIGLVAALPGFIGFAVVIGLLMYFCCRERVQRCIVSMGKKQAALHGKLNEVEMEVERAWKDRKAKEEERRRNDVISGRHQIDTVWRLHEAQPKDLEHGDHQAWLPHVGMSKDKWLAVCKRRFGAKQTDKQNNNNNNKKTKKTKKKVSEEQLGDVEEQVEVEDFDDEDEDDDSLINFESMKVWKGKSYLALVPPEIICEICKFVEGGSMALAAGAAGNHDFDDNRDPHITIDVNVFG